MAEVTLELAATSRAPLVAGASIQRQGASTGVWRLASGKPVFTAVRLGASSLDGQIQVLDGLKAGDEVVVFSQKTLTSDSRVQVVDSLVKSVVTGTAP
jgi:HlyD family secretion protein